MPPRCRIPLPREPSAHGSPPPPAYSHQSIRRPGSLKITASCAQRPVVPVTVVAPLLPGPQGQPGTNRASPSRILHASPSLRTVIFDWARANRKETPALSWRGPFPWAQPEKLVGLQVFFPLCAPSAARRSCLSPSTRPLSLIRGPERGALRRFLPRAALLRGLIRGEGRETGPSSRAQKKHHENQIK